MPTYVSLINWTEQGIRGFRDTTTRAAEFTKRVENAGGKVREVLWTLGDYDIVAVTEFPDDESVAAALLEQCSAGSIRTKTMRGFQAKEMDDIIKRTG